MATVISECHLCILWRVIISILIKRTEVTKNVRFDAIKKTQESNLVLWTQGILGFLINFRICWWTVDTSGRVIHREYFKSNYGFIYNLDTEVLERLRNCVSKHGAVRTIFAETLSINVITCSNRAETIIEV